MVSEERLYFIPNLEKGICQFIIPGHRKCLINFGSKEVTVIQSQSLTVIALVFSEQPHWKVRIYLVREYISMTSALTNYQCIFSVLHKCMCAKEHNLKLRNKKMVCRQIVLVPASWVVSGTIAVEVKEALTAPVEQ